LTLAPLFFHNFPADDLRLRSTVDLYSCLCAMLQFLNDWQSGGPKVKLFNPDLQLHGWDSRHTVVVFSVPEYALLHRVRARRDQSTQYPCVYPNEL
jgi:NAD-specific glutamate dehydrogenase